MSMEKYVGFDSVGQLARRCDRKNETGGGVRSNQVKRLG